MIDKIASAEFVLTGSLHGAITASAYEVPFAFWDNGHLDIPFKWQDFAASIGIPSLFARNVREGRHLYETLIRPRKTLLPLTPMLDVCPFVVKPSVFFRAMAHDGVGSWEAFQSAALALDQLNSLDTPVAKLAASHSASFRRRRAGLLHAASLKIGHAVRSAKRAYLGQK